MFTGSRGHQRRPDQVATTDSQAASPVILPLYCCVTGRGAAVGNSFVEVGIVTSGSGDEDGVEAGGLLVGVGAVIGGVDWAVGSWVVGGGLVVSSFWLHPYRDKPISALAAAI
jgi:hypothetical protein